MAKGKLAMWINNNLVLLVCVPLIVGVHYGWSKLQEVPYLVDQSQRNKEMPIIAAFKSFTNKLRESNKPIPQEPQEK
ncbi:hypothetical protein NQ315_006872 [Exocentrus adspersus]|uniref:Uncharacterized protein n=1 Tax=Exocentrus adspersus TaxID=1586481 RepID=A0AAV8WBY3_9CUCU|nr:hypothetical protein NQ315_006872 [Exocentrus adspersus]